MAHTTNNIDAIVHQTTEDAKRKRKRTSDQISQCDAHLAKLLEAMKATNAKKRRLEKKRELQTTVATLHTTISAATVWKRLIATHHDPYKKEHVLCVMNNVRSDDFPPELEEDQWARSNNAHLDVLRGDRDILLARLARKTFPDHYISQYVYGRDPNPPLFRLPGSLYIDKEVCIATVKRYPEIILQDKFPKAFLRDPAVFLAYVQSDRLKVPTRYGSGCNDKTLFRILSSFSKGIRGNASFMLQAAKNTTVNTVMDHFDDALTSNVVFAQKLVELMKEAASLDRNSAREDALGRFTAPVRAHRPLVLALVKKNGRCLQDAAPELQRDSKVLRAACHNNASALLFAIPGCWAVRQLCKDKAFIMDIFSQWPVDVGGEPQLYKRLVPALKMDLDVIVAAHLRGNISFVDVPRVLSIDANFWLDVIKRESSIWRALPDEFATDPTFARAIEQFHFDDEELMDDVFTRFPFLTYDRDVWRVAFTSRGSWILENAPEQILSDKELMMEACKLDPDTLLVVSEELKQDRDIIESAISKSGLAYYCIPHPIQSLYPDLVAKALWELRGCQSSCLDPDYVAEDLWVNLEVLSAWFTVGGAYHHNIPETMTDKPEFGLVVAKCCYDRYEEECGGCESCLEFLVTQFRKATSNDLRSNKAFMMQAVGLSPPVFFEVGYSLRRDFDLAVLAFSGKNGRRLPLKGFLQPQGRMERGEYDDYNDDLEFLYSVRRFARAKVADSSGFMKVFLPGISEHSGNASHLQTLNCSDLTQLIAEYVGVANGEQLRVYQRAAAHLGALPGPLRIPGCPCGYCS